MKDLIPRINELAKKSKTEGLTEEEKQEQKELRDKYIAAFRGNLDNTLMGVKVVDPEGNDITPQRLKEKQENLKKN